MKFVGTFVCFNVLLFITSILLSTQAHAISCQAYFRVSDLSHRMSTDSIADNPLIQKSPLENGVYPEYNKIKPEHFIPALRDAQVKAEMLLTQIRNEQNPTFESIVLKLEDVSRIFSKPMEIFGAYASSFKTADIKAIEEVYSETTSNFYSTLSTDPKLFSQIKKVYENRANLEADQKLLVEDSYKSFARNGSELVGAEKDRMIAINTELSALADLFANNLTDYRATHFIHITDAKQLAGIPEDVVNALRQAAEKRGLAGAVIEMSQPSLAMSVMEKADSNELRKELFFMSGRNGYEKGDYNNEALLRKIAELRQERAALLKYPNHAEYVLEERMAQNLKNVQEFIESLVQAYTPKAEAENQMLADFKNQKTGSPDVLPWERSFWVKKLETERLNFDSEVFKEYLSYSNVKNGFFNLVQKMYGLKLIERPDLPRIDNDMEVVEVRSENNELYGFVIIDMYAREIKRGGAWMNQILSSIQENGQRTPAIVSINMNLAKPEGTNPFLLKLDDGETFFHEFGHALHGLLTKARYFSQSGTNVKWDFVELPSQVMENFFLDPEVMSTFAFHYKTKEPVPKEYLQKLTALKQMFSGNYMLNSLALSRLDLAWHDGTALKMTGTLAEIDNAILNLTRAVKMNEDISRSSAFSHIFSGGYSAGYYSYFWAQVLDADAYSVMKRGGVPAARNFLKYVLEVGGSMDPNVAYENFAGRKPSTDALLERDGIKKP